jgi:predicted permease
VLGVIIGCFVAGIVLARLAPATRSWSTPLDRLVLWFLLPALILAKLPSAHLGAEVAIPIAAAWGALLLAWTATLAVGRSQRWDRRTTGSVLMMASFGNTSYLGLAAVEALLGAGAVASAVAYDQLGNFVGVTVVGTVICSRWGDGDASAAGILRKLLTFPAFDALLVTIALRHWPLPDGATDVLADLGRLVGPVAMFAIGLRFRRPRSQGAWHLASIDLALKMALMPLAVLAAGAAFGDLSETAWQASVLQAGMPPMVLAGIMATEAGLDDELSSFVIGAGLVLSALTLPLLNLLVT